MNKKIIIVSILLLLLLTTLSNVQAYSPQYQTKGGATLSIFLYELNQIPPEPEYQQYRQQLVVLYFMSVAGNL